jgi:hypothetical protein
MKKMFAIMLLASAVTGGGLVACGGKKASTTPKPQEMNGDPNGGAGYGGAAYGGHKAAAPTGKATPNPCASH